MPEYWNGVFTAFIVIAGIDYVVLRVLSACIVAWDERAERRKRDEMVNEVVERRTPR